MKLNISFSKLTIFQKNHILFNETLNFVNAINTKLLSSSLNYTSAKGFWEDENVKSLRKQQYQLQQTMD